ncbi:phosphatidylinositol phosphatase PTPRQ isoform X2 [Harpegnathos saltator]|uniref:phosphatidylinositol phosphatase PTPRQ isoform X2 n=1 Tax=Harpegnathos saltator TaxID=610380 RepID=UPI00058BC29F|nr:phosphatidylinositol phosphatase PTPRQ isoform X2 [Harpegnathos saltator]
MILEKHLVLLIHALYFLCARCDDDAFTSRETTIVTSMELSHDLGSTESLMCCDSTTMSGLTSQDPGSTSSLDGSTIYEHSTTIMYESSTDNQDKYLKTDIQADSNTDETSTSSTSFLSTVDETFLPSTLPFSSTVAETPSSTSSYLSTVDETLLSSTSPFSSTVTKTFSSTSSSSSTIDETSSSSTVDFSTQTAKTTDVPDNVTSSSTVDPTCDSSWPINATDYMREVVDLKRDEIGTEWVVLSWDPPCIVTTNVSIKYSVERCDHEQNCNQTIGYETSHNVTDLDACTQYTFVVKIITNFWTSNGVKLQAATDNAIPEIGEVRSLSVGAFDVNTVQLTWLAPEKHANCVSNYSILQCIGQSCNATTVSAVNYTANNLEMCTQYNFTVKTLTLTVESAGVNTSATTASPIPSELQSMIIISSNFSLAVQWEPPQSGLTCLKHYRVVVAPVNISFTTVETNVTISNLYACVSYSVSVNAVNKDNQDGPVTCKTKETSQTRTNPPTLHTGDLVTVDSISIIVSIQRDNNRCLLNTLVATCNYTSTNGTGFELMNGVATENIDPKSAEGSFIFMNMTVKKLSPFTEYICKAYVINMGGQSDNSNGVTAQTMEDVPSPPSFLVMNITESQFSLTWNRPEYLAGNVEDYEIALAWMPLFPVPAWCTPEVPNSDEIMKLNDTQSYDYHKAKAYRQYKIRMRAKTGAGWGSFGALQTIQSNAAISDVVSKFEYKIEANPKDTNTLDTILTWGIPCSLNGKLDVFNVSVHGTRDGYENHTFSILEECIDYVDNDYICLVNLKELKGEYNYTFSVYPKILQVDTPGPMTSQAGILYPAGIPPLPDDEYVKWITIDPFKAIKSTTTATVLLPLFYDTNGNIKYYAIMVSELGYNKPTSTRFNLKEKSWPNVSSWKEAMMSDFSITYQATRPKWNPYPSNIADYGRMKAVKFVIGADTVCKDISSNDANARSPVYCNGPLKPDTWYHVRIRAFTEGGYADSQIFVVKTNAELNVAIVIGVVFGILFLGILTTMMLLVRKCSPVLRRFLHSDMPGSPVPAPFTRKKFIAHCQQLVDNPGKLSNEFRLLQTLSVDLQMPTNSACLQANRKKNRYSDILPYDFSRVKLEVIDNDPNTDYINASFIRGYTGEDEYIACQGPKEETTYDFWRMVDQYNINIIVMLTQLVEKGKEKCHQYYPTIRETFRYENMTIRCTSELDFRTYTQRTLVLQKENKKRSIIQLHFKDWPDHDVPEDFDPMINFCQIMRRNISASKGFVVVHCSAGIGRTGTLIAIDILLQHLRDNRKLDIFGTVYRLRHHRINMVQRESQYAYIYNCIKQVLKNPYFLKTYKPPPVDPVYENISKKAKDTASTDQNLVNSLEILKRYNSSVSMESLETIHNFFPWSYAEQQRSAVNSGLRQYKSMDGIDKKTRHNIMQKARTLESVIHKSLNLKDSMNKKLNSQNLTQESYPLITCSNSADVFGDSSQYATDNM